MKVFIADKKAFDAKMKAEAEMKQAQQQLIDEAEAKRLAQPRCTTCRFWLVEEGQERADNQTNRCVYDAPTFIGSDLKGVWPKTFGYSRCGRYELLTIPE